MAQSWRGLMTDMESSFLAIFLDAMSQMAQLAESKVFVVLESSDGLRYGNGSTMNACVYLNCFVR